MGGLTGLFLGNVTVDLPLSDTYFVVGHFHMVMGVSPVLVVFGAIYHWFPKITGRMFNEALGKAHFWLTLPRVPIPSTFPCTTWASSACRGATTPTATPTSFPNRRRR